MRFGIILSNLRMEKQLKQKDLAQALGISAGTIGMYETHQRRPTIEMLMKIAQYFNVTTDYLLGLSDFPETGDHLSDEEHKLIDTFRCLDADQKQVVLGKAAEFKIAAAFPKKDTE